MTPTQCEIWGIRDLTDTVCQIAIYKEKLPNLPQIRVRPLQGFRGGAPRRGVCHSYQYRLIVQSESPQRNRIEKTMLNVILNDKTILDGFNLLFLLWDLLCLRKELL